MMASDRCFIDSNIPLYLISSSLSKSAKANEIVSAGPLISVQVLNEFVSVARKKYNKDWNDILDVLDFVRENCEVVPLTIETHDRALEFSSTSFINIYDANILAAAELSGCDTLYTEDLSNGQRIGRVTIVNPFV